QGNDDIGKTGQDEGKRKDEAQGKSHGVGKVCSCAQHASPSRHAVSALSYTVKALCRKPSRKLSDIMRCPAPLAASIDRARSRSALCPFRRRCRGADLWALCHCLSGCRSWRDSDCCCRAVVPNAA